MTNGQASACLSRFVSAPVLGRYRHAREEPFEVHAKFKEEDLPSHPSDMCLEEGRKKKGFFTSPPRLNNVDKRCYHTPGFTRAAPSPLRTHQMLPATLKHTEIPLLVPGGEH